MPGANRWTGDAPAPRLRGLKPRINWPILSVIVFVHLMAVAAVAYLSTVRLTMGTVILFSVWLVLCGLSITGGYHRLFAHPTYRAAWPVRLLYVLFGAASMQGSVLRWSADHRKHHARTDEPSDPHNIREGFWWAHVGWLFRQRTGPGCGYRHVRDLHADPLIRFQHRYYVALAFFMGAVVPLAIGLSYGDPVGALLCAGFLRLTLQWHATWAINSVAHYIGDKPYQADSSARDSWVTALVTFGEGYHNYHHRFPTDYRNGVRWHHFDPTKWLVWTLSKVGLASDLRRTPPTLIAGARKQAAAARNSLPNGNSACDAAGCPRTR